MTRRASARGSDAAEQDRAAPDSSEAARSGSASEQTATGDAGQAGELERLRHENEALRAEVELLRERDRSAAGDLQRMKELAAASRKVEADLKALIENTDDFILFSDANAQPVYFNQNYARAMKELLGVEMKPGLQPHALLEAPARAFWDGLHQRVLAGESFKAEFPFEHEGRLRTFEVRYNPVRDGDRIVGFSEYTREITDRKEAEAELIAARDLLQQDYDALSEGMRDGFVLHEVVELPSGGFDFRFLAANAAFERISGVSRDDCVGRLVSEVFPGAPPRFLEAYAAVARTGEPQRFEYHLGERGLFLDVLAFRPRRGRCATLLQNVSPQKQLAEQQRRAERLESIGVLAGGIAHDFNNILASLLASIQMAQWALDSRSEAATILGESVHACERAGQLTKQLITFARGGQPVKRRLLVGDALQEWASFALRGSNVVEKVEICPDLWPLEADEGQLAQVIHNLVVNAAQAMPDGGTVTIRVDNVTVDADRAGHRWVDEKQCVRIAVVDHGIGIPRELLKRVFDPYFTTKSDGSGLGLATSYSIVRDHGGFIDVHSTEGRGTKFEVYLPATSSAPASAGEERAGVPLGSERLLLMDDDEQLRELATKLLMRLGYSVDAVADGASAVDAYAKSLSKGRYHAVLLDLTVPGGMGGREALERLREIDSGVRALVMSGYSTDPVMANYTDYGFCDVIPKPFTAESLAIALRRSLDSGRSAGAADTAQAPKH